VVHAWIGWGAAALVSLATIQAQTTHTSPKDVAIALAKNGIRAGAIISLDEFASAERSWSAARPSLLPPAAGAAVERAVSDFTQTHPQFRIERGERSVRLIRRDTPTEVLQALASARDVPAREQVSISAALVEVVGSLIKRRTVSGVLGSGGMPGPGCPLGALVRVSAGHVSPLDALDDLVSQVPGLSWFVLYDAEHAHEPVHIGLWCQDGDAFRVQLPR